MNLLITLCFVHYKFTLIILLFYVEMEFEKRRKRRKLFRERSISPIVVDDEASVPSSPLQKLLTNTARRADSASTAGHDTQLKALFLFKFDLQPVDLQLKQSEIYFLNRLSVFTY